jgi:YVTN family beta-propeller protein
VLAVPGADRPRRGGARRAGDGQDHHVSTAVIPATIPPAQATRPGRRRSKGASMRTAALFLLATAACTASEGAVRPPEDQFYYPTGIAVSPDESVLFVENANGDLQYDSGALNVVDLSIVDSYAAGWTGSQTIPDGCSQDTDFSETLVCDEAPFIRTGTGVRIGNFSTDIAVQDRGNGNLRLIAPTRGDPSITWIDWDGSALSCSATGQTYDECDDVHRLSYLRNDTNLSTIAPEPFDAFVDSAGEYAVVTDLSTGDVNLLASPADGDAEIVDINVSFFQPNPTTGLLGAAGVAGRTPGAPDDIVYVGSVTENRIQTLTVDEPINNATASIVPSNYFFLNGVGGNSGVSSDTRGMQFSPSGDRLYLINRMPPTLQIIDTSLDAQGFPANQLVGATDICRAGSTLAIADTGAGERVYVTCFDDGEVYVIDPSDQGSVEHVFTVGRGPYDIAVSPTRKKLYVSNYLEDTISVIELTPGSPLQYHVVLRLGVPKAPVPVSSSGNTNGYLGY